MNKSNLKFRNIDEYHASFPAGKQKILQQLRKLIKQTVPRLTETISYGMPAFKQNKILVYYALHKEHIGFYPTPKPILVYKAELAKYKTSKGAIQFPIDKPLPLTLIKKIVKFRAAEDLEVSKPNSEKYTVSEKKIINRDIQAYNNKLSNEDKVICNILFKEINENLSGAENKIWHGHPVWFLDGNPIVGYHKLKDCIRLLFWSGQSFNEQSLKMEGKFKAAEARYTSAEQINKKDLKRWLKKSRDIQWDYKNIVKRKGVLERIK